jgi:hypothetical protein
VPLEPPPFAIGLCFRKGQRLLFLSQVALTGSSFRGYLGMIWDFFSGFTVLYESLVLHRITALTKIARLMAGP